VSDASKNDWEKVSRSIGLYRYVPNGRYFACVRYRGKLHRKSLNTTDSAVAKRKLADFRRTLERTDAVNGNKSFAAVLDEYRATLIGAKSTVEDKHVIIDKLKNTLFGAETLPLRHLTPSQIKTWLAAHYGNKSASYYNSALMLVRDALEAAVRDRIIAENPARDLKYRKRKKPIRLTPTFEQFNQMVAEIRAQKFNQVAQQSGDFIEFIGLAGLGAAEAASLTPAEVDFEAGHIIAYRHKSDTGFAVPIYPQVRPLLEKLCAGKAHNERLFQINEARKALTNACVRLGLCFGNFATSICPLGSRVRNLPLADTQPSLYLLILLPKRLYRVLPIVQVVDLPYLCLQHCLGAIEARAQSRVYDCLFDSITESCSSN
jgi:integrase